ncbi:uncharacterized protein TNCV_3187581 [Trichonephila clavipes]|nr:uncharacterized protein TNCV_3187581 [Trichonephila clavipes]
MWYIGGISTWQRRGYTSMNGCVAAISVDTGKVLDIEVMSSYCPTCKRLQTMPRNFEYESSKADHICQCNFTGSSSKMEIMGASRIFLRSEKNRRLHYTQYYGDGDSKAFMIVKDTYGLNSVTKFECIGHVQKRVEIEMHVSDAVRRRPEYNILRPCSLLLRMEEIFDVQRFVQDEEPTPRI